VFSGMAKGKSFKGAIRFYYAGTGNKFIELFKSEVGFVLIKKNPAQMIVTTSICKIGLTDLVHTVSGNDNEINKKVMKQKVYNINKNIQSKNS
jgi:hypothetical protein